MKSKQLWNINDVISKIDKKTEADIDATVQVIYAQCLAFAQRAKNEHTYKNYKGELESSVGVVVLKDRNEVKEWSALASDGTDPSRGISDYTDVLSTYILGQAQLPDGTLIPAKSIVGIVFAAAPYAGIIENGEDVPQEEWTPDWQGVAGKKVLNAFAPAPEDIFTVLKTIIR